MEAASLFSIAKFRHVNLSRIVWISDDVSHPGWNPQFRSTEYARGRDGALEAAVGVFS
jgi:hypothetical protein